ncbi:DUF4391 domain-containing protein [Aquabacterium sp. A08]|uniref:DUF4391 domain-containing protein n=1 Tax=Aquabacterium sp. A08 TaxID=2718532 RepID=UPI00353039CF
MSGTPEHLTPEQILSGMRLPPSAMVNQRVPKKMLVESGAPTAADKRLISDGIEDIHWLAALKPVTVGIPAYQDAVRDYLEIAVLNISLRPLGKANRIAELVHRAIPYPTFLMVHSQSSISISLAHKRWAQNEAGKTVLDGDILETNLHSPERPDLAQLFVDALPLEKQPRSSLHALYQGWMDTIIALQTAFVKGVFSVSSSREQATERHQALLESKRLQTELGRLRSLAAKERQVAKQVELNLAIKRIQGDLGVILGKL